MGDAWYSAFLPRNEVSALRDLGTVSNSTQLHRMKPQQRSRAALAAVLLLSACANPPLIPPPLALPASPGDGGAVDGLAAPREPGPGARFERVPGPAESPVPRRTAIAPAAPPPVPGTDAGIALNFDQMPLPAFVQLVYGEILKRNVQIDPKVAERKDLVTLRSGGNQSAAEVERVAKKVLQSYGVAVIDADALVRVVPDSSVAGYLPEIQRGAALPDAPAGLRPQFYLVELKAVRQNEVIGWLKTLFADRLKLVEDNSRNAILISGAPETLQSALDALRVLDQPSMAGHQSLRISPALWTAEDLARRLFDMLTAEGYAVQPIGQQQGGGVRYPIILLPVPAVNAIYVFANSPEILDHVQSWASSLDKPSDRGGIGRNFFTYRVQNIDAAELAGTLAQLMGARTAATGSAVPRTGTSSAPASGAAPASLAATGVVVDKGSNTLIFQGSAEDYPQVRALLTALDRPPKQALIEVTVAEVQLTGNWQLGVEWAFSKQLANGNTSAGGTVGGTGLGTGGFSYQLLGPVSQVRAAFNALAADNRTTILSSPRIMARNGEQASIEVGQQVPIITSQQTSLAAPATNQAGVLQTVEYHDTGVILHVKPVIHSSDEIELEVQQEVSAAQATTTGVSSSRPSARARSRPASRSRTAPP